MTTFHSDSDPTPPRSCDSVCSLDLPFSQAMHRSKSFRALVLFGVVALVTALYQSITPPSSALTIPTGLTPRVSVLKRAAPVHMPLNSMRRVALTEAFPMEPPPPPIGA